MKRATLSILAIVLVALFAAVIPTTAAAQISVTAANPNNAPQGTVNLNVIINGNGFKKGALAKFFVSGTPDTGGVTVTATAFNNNGQLTATITVADTAVVAGFDIQVMNADGRTGKGTDMFAVTTNGNKTVAPTCPVLTPLVTAPASCMTGQPGCLDTTFGADPSYPGMVFTDTDGVLQDPNGHNYDMDGGRTVTEMADGRIVAIGATTKTLPTSPLTYQNGFAAVRYNSDGSLDATFGNGGVAKYFFSAGSAQPQDGLLQPDGKVVGVGYIGGTYANHGAVVRFNVDGSVDTTFGSNGTFILTEHGKNKTSDWNVYFEGVVLDSNNNLLLGAYTSGGCQAIRLTPAGALDSSFGSGGIATLPGSFSCGEGNSIPVAIQSTPAGNYILIGGSINGTFGVARLNWNGTLNSSFGSNGNGTVTTSWCGSGNDSVHALAVDGNGNIFAAGRAQWGASTSTINFGVAKYTANGTLDSTFGYVAPGATQPSGKAAFDIAGGSDGLRSVLVQTDGRILLSGDPAVSGFAVTPYTVVRLNPDGSLDQTFGSGNGNAGVVMTVPQGAIGGYAFRMSLDSAGRILQTGPIKFDTGPYASWNFAIIRYIP